MSEKHTHSPERFERVIESALQEPIPHMDDLRAHKAKYRELPIAWNGLDIYEPLVRIAQAPYNLAGQPYYSRPNNATGEAVLGVPAEIYVRESIAEKLAAINRSLQHPIITDFFDGEVELYVEDGLRPYWLQKELRHNVFPQLIRQRMPGVSAEALEEELNRFIAKPADFDDPDHPTPHRTGAAVDLAFRYRQDTRLYVPGALVPRGLGDAELGDRVFPDYFELHPPSTEEAALFQRNRRAMYAILTGKAFDVHEPLLYVNPSELFHWGNGDPLSAWIAGEQAARYSIPPDEAAVTGVR